MALTSDGPPGAEAFEPDPAVGALCAALFGVVRGLRRVGDGEARPRDLLERHGLAPRHVVALAYLALGGPMSVSLLAQRLGVARTTASLLVAELAAAGLVDRREDSHDHRRTIATVSPTNRSEVREMVEVRLVPIRRAVAKLGSERVAELTASLAVLAEELAHRPTAATTGAPGDHEGGAS